MNQAFQNLFKQSTNFLSKLYLLCLALWSTSLYWTFLHKAANRETFFDLMDRTHMFADFAGFYVMGQLAWSSDRHGLYDYPTQMAWLVKCAGDLVSLPDPLPVTPMFSLCMGPLTQLPVEQAFLVWLIGGLLAALLVLWALASTVRRLNFREMLIFYILVLSPMPLIEIFKLGQAAFVWLVLTGLFYLYFLTDSDIKAGFVLSLLTFKPQYFLFLSACPIGCKRWRVLLTALVFSSIWVVLSAQVLGWQTILVYPKFLHEYGSSESTFVPGHNPTLGMINLRGLLAPFVEGRLLFEVVSFINLAVWLPIFLCWRFADRQGKHAYQWVIALSVSATLFFSAHSLFYDFVMIAVGWAVTIDSDDINAPLRAARPWHLLWVATFWLLPALTWLLGALKVRYETSANLHALLLLYIACLAFIRLLQTRQTVPQTNAA